jgi:hypothetical protein
MLLEDGEVLVSSESFDHGGGFVHQRLGIELVRRRNDRAWKGKQRNQYQQCNNCKMSHEWTLLPYLT